MLPIFLIMNRLAARRRFNKCGKPIQNGNLSKRNTLGSEAQHCRTCLGTQNLENIFCNKESEQKRSNDFYLICGLEIRADDGLPQTICHQCSETLEVALQFRKTSRKSEKKLMNLALNPKEICINNSKTEKRKAKTEKEEADIDCSYNEYDDQVDGYYDADDVKAEDIPEKCCPTKRKRVTLPNALSYRCNTCNKDFKMKATYKAHMRFHTNYCVCESCGKRCRNNNQLQEHKRARHGLGRIHKCAYCEYSSATKEALIIHERRHTGERPYVCDHCGATFHRRSNLVQHIAIHLPEKNFQCSICSKWEKSRKLLQVHVHKRHRESRYRYVCPMCGETFARPANVRHHLVRAHHVPRERQGLIHKYEKQFMEDNLQ